MQVKKAKELTAIVAGNTVEARLELVAAAALAAHAVIEALNVGGKVAGSSRGGEGEQDGVADEHFEYLKVN